MSKEKDIKAAYIRALLKQTKPMDIIATANGSLVSRWIRYKLDSEVSHAFVVARDPSKGYSIEWRPEQVDLFDYLMSKNFIIRRMPKLAPRQIEDALRLAEAKVFPEGNKKQIYPLTDIAAMTLQNWLRPGQKGLKWNSEGEICSEFVSRLYREGIGIRLRPGLGKADPMMTPLDVITDDRLQTVGYWKIDF